MSNPRYTAEMRERAVKMVMQVRRESGQEKGAVARVAQQLGIVVRHCGDGSRGGGGFRGAAGDDK